MTEPVWLVLGGAAAVGLGLGVGLVIGVLVARALRRYMRDELTAPDADGSDDRRR